MQPNIYLQIMRKPTFKSEVRICHICNKIIFNSDDLIDHFRNGDEKHKEEYAKVNKFLQVSEGVTDKKLIEVLIEKYLS